MREHIGRVAVGIAIVAAVLVAIIKIGSYFMLW
jgi:hypothetical protein